MSVSNHCDSFIPLLRVFWRKKNVLSWISHYSGSARGCGQSLNFSEFISNFIHRTHIVNYAQTCSHRAIQYITSKYQTYKSVRTIKVILSYAVIMSKYMEVAKVLTDGWECETGENKGLHTEEPAPYCCTGCSSTWSFSCSRQSNSSGS